MRNPGLELDDDLIIREFNIPTGESYSTETFDTRLLGMPVGIVFPAAWTDGNLEIQDRRGPATPWLEVRNVDGDVISFDMAAGTRGHLQHLDPLNFVGVAEFRIRSGTAAVPVQQAGDRVGYLRFRRRFATGHRPPRA